MRFGTVVLLILFVILIGFVLHFVDQSNDWEKVDEGTIEGMNENSWNSKATINGKQYVIDEDDFFKYHIGDNVTVWKNGLGHIDLRGVK